MDRLPEHIKNRIYGYIPKKELLISLDKNELIRYVSHKELIDRLRTYEEIIDRLSNGIRHKECCGFEECERCGFYERHYEWSFESEADDALLLCSHCMMDV